MSTTDQDLYQQLGVPRDADLKTIKDAYHRLAMKWHPDRNKAPEAEARFKDIARAYAILSDPDKRARYDARGMEGVAHYSHDDLFGGLDLGSIFGDLGFGFGPGGDSVFDRFFGTGRPSARRGLDLRVSLQVPLEIIANGGQETVHFTRNVECPQCHGYGTADGQSPPVCPECGGTGHQVRSTDQTREHGRTVHIQQIGTCPRCEGRGVMPTEICERCGGQTLIERHETLKVSIPPGIEDGMALRVTGHGLAADMPGHPAGDLLVVVITRPDARFQRHGADLWRSESLTLEDAVLGTKRLVPTLSGDVQVKIPAGTQPDTVLRLARKGLPRIDGAGHGDLNLRLQVEVPTRLTREEKRLFKELRRLHEKNGRDR